VSPYRVPAPHPRHGAWTGALVAPAVLLGAWLSALAWLECARRFDETAAAALVAVILGLPCLLAATAGAYRSR